jgi:hypothetical protein
VAATPHSPLALQQLSPQPQLPPQLRQVLLPRPQALTLLRSLLRLQLQRQQWRRQQRPQAR